MHALSVLGFPRSLVIVNRNRGCRTWVVQTSKSAEGGLPVDHPLIFRFYMYYRKTVTMQFLSYSS